MYFTSGSDRAFEHLMQGKPGFDHYDSGEAGAPEDCGDCRFYRPGWKYQFCVYAECPYQPGKLTAYDAVLFQVKLPVGTDARIFPISQDIRTGYEMGFIRLFIQQFQQQEQAALIIFLQRNSPIYSLGPDFRPQVQSYSATTSLNRVRMAAASARVAWPLGSKTPSPLPLISPSALAHWRASRA